jgi:hypothetical protein
MMRINFNDYSYPAINEMIFKKQKIVFSQQ